MMSGLASEFERFERDPARRRLLRQEQFILATTEALCEALDRAQVSKSELARRLGKSKGLVSQLLSGGRNLTIRTIADIADALDLELALQLSRRDVVVKPQHWHRSTERWEFPKLAYSSRPAPDMADHLSGLCEPRESVRGVA